MTWGDHFVAEMANNINLLDELNSKNIYDSSDYINQFIIDDDSDFNIFSGLNMKSIYYDITSFTNKFKHSKNPVIVSLNVQSIMSKFDSLSNFIYELLSRNINIDVIVLQETWAVQYPESIIIKGYQTISLQSRKTSKGRGVGFFVRKIWNLES